MNYKNKSKEELLLDVYRLEVAVNKGKERIEKLEDLIEKIKEKLVAFKESNFFKKVYLVTSIIVEILNVIKSLDDDNSGDSKAA